MISPRRLTEKFTYSRKNINIPAHNGENINAPIKASITGNKRKFSGVHSGQNFLGTGIILTKEQTINKDFNIFRTSFSVKVIGAGLQSHPSHEDYFFFLFVREEIFLRQTEKVIDITLPQNLKLNL